jgi:hypothetical protein
MGAGIGWLVGLVAGGVVARVIKSRHTADLEDQIEHGGIPLWVRTSDEDHERKACEIMMRANAKDVHVHDRPKVEDTDVVYGYLDRISGIAKPSARQRRVLY